MPDSVAEMEYRILLEFEPDNLEVRYKLGMILFRSGKYEEAANEFNYILKKDGAFVDAFLGLGKVNANLSNYKQAISQFQKALSINPDDMHIYFYLGQTLEMQGDLPGAEEVYKNGLSRDIKSQSKHTIEERQLVVEALENLQKNKEKTLGQN